MRRRLLKRPYAFVGCFGFAQVCVSVLQQGSAVQCFMCGQYGAGEMLAVPSGRPLHSPTLHLPILYPPCHHPAPGTMMVREGDAAGMVSGAMCTTANTIRPALQVRVRCMAA